MVHRIMQRNSVYTRSGHTMTLPSPASRFSTIGWPADLRASFLRPSLSANHTKNATRKIIPAIGTLSGFRTMSAKLGSRQENRNRTPSTANRMPPTFGRYTDSTGRVRRRSHAGPSSPGKSRTRKAAIVRVKKRGGADSELTAVLSASIIESTSSYGARDATVLADAPEVHGHQDDRDDRDPDAVQDIEAQKRTGPDEPTVTAHMASWSHGSR